MFDRARIDGGIIVIRSDVFIRFAVRISELIERLKRSGGLFEHATKRSRHCQILDHQISLRIAISQINHGRDGRANGFAVRCGWYKNRPRFVGDGVGGLR